MRWMQQWIIHLPLSSPSFLNSTHTRPHTPLPLSLPLLSHLSPPLVRFDALDAAVDGRWPAYWPGRPADTASSSSSSTITPPVPPLPLQGASGCVSGCSSTAVVIRTLHALPPGTELTQSYFPLNWGLQERQQQAQQVTAGLSAGQQAQRGFGILPISIH